MENAMNKKQSNNGGFALASVLIIILVLMILGTALLSVVFSDTKHAIYSENNLEAHFLARSGADIVSNDIIMNRAIPTGIIGVKRDLSDTFGTKSYTVDSITTIGNKINVVVSGEANGILDKVTLELDVVAGEETVFQRPFHVNNLVVSTNLDINYPSGFTDAERLAHKPLSGADAQPFVYPSPTIASPILPKNSPFALTITNGQTVQLNTSKSFSNVTIDGGRLLLNSVIGSTLQLVIEDTLEVTKHGSDNGVIEVTGDGNVEIYVDTMTFNQDTQLLITGEARVKLFVMTTAMINNPLTNISNTSISTPDQLMIILNDYAVLDLGSNANLTAYVYGPKATIYMNSNSTTINGALIGNVFNKNDGSNAPNGVINYIPPDDSYPEYNGVTGYIKSQYKRGN
jgi:hypothetical protein